MPDPGDLGADLRATLAAREELGPRYQGALVESFLENLDRSLDAKVASAIAAQQVRRRGRFGAAPIASVALAIPVSAIVTTQLHGAWGFFGLVVSWAGIAAVNVAHSIGGRR